VRGTGAESAQVRRFLAAGHAGPERGCGVGIRCEAGSREVTSRSVRDGPWLPRVFRTGGLLGKLTKIVVEGALEGELDDHLGYGKHDPAGRDGGNSRNEHQAKTVITDTGPVEISVPRERDSSFELKIVANGISTLGSIPTSPTWLVYIPTYL
jgi:hypothetical protein